MKKNLLTVACCVAFVVCLAILYPVATQSFFVKVVFHAKKLEYELFHGSVANKSAGSRAIEDLLRMRPEPPLDDIIGMRKQQDSALSALFPISGAVEIEEVDIRNGLQAVWVLPPNVDRNNKTCQVILYVHGGAFTSGSFEAYGGFVSELAQRAEVKLLFVKYGLAPEHPLAQQAKDIVDAFDYLMRQKVHYRRIVIVGDSSGGGLVLLALQKLQQRFTPTMPNSAVTFSAWTDLFSSKEPKGSFSKNKDKDAVLKLHWLQHRALVATGTEQSEYAKRKSPDISPMYWSPDPTKFPKLLMQVGTEEILYDDTVDYARKVKKLGINVTVAEYKGMQHVGVIFWDYYEEASQALDDAVKWIRMNVFPALTINLNDMASTPTNDEALMAWMAQRRFSH